MANAMRVCIRELQTLDILPLDRMYHTLSNRSKLFLHLGYLGFESIGFSWLGMHAALFLSTIGIIRRILKHLFPILTFFSLVAVSEENILIGFSLLKLKGRKTRNGWWGELIIGLKNGHRGKGLGSKLLKVTIDNARKEEVKGIFASALRINVSARTFFKKHGFKTMRIVENQVNWFNWKYDSVEMWLDLGNP